MKRITYSLLSAIFLWLGSCCILTGQVPVAQSDQITTDGQEIQNDDSGTGTFEPVIVDAGANSDVSLQFPISLANKPVIVQPLDGGTLLGINGEFATVGPDGQLSFQFKAGGTTGQPGLYRVLVISPDSGDNATAAVVGIIQFAVPPAQ